MSYRDGSANFQTRRSEGWVVGPAAYADEEPHHGPGYGYHTMHDAGRDALLTRIIEGAGDERDTGPWSATVTVVQYWPAGSDDAERDYYAADARGDIRTSLVRNLSGIHDEIELRPERDGYDLAICGWDVCERRGGDWQAVYYDAEISRV